jgi:hypothetical protein
VDALLERRELVAVGEIVAALTVLPVISGA